MRESTVETLVGAAVLAAAGAFLYYTVSVTGAGATTNTYPLVAKFFRADGIAPGAEVRLAGVRVGSVRSMGLDPVTFQAVVEMDVNRSVQAPTDSSVKIMSDGLLGGAFLAIDPGGAEEVLQPGEVFLYTQGSVNLLDLVGKAFTGGAE